MISVVLVNLIFSATKRLYEKACDIAPLQGPQPINGSTLAPLILASVFFVARIFAKGSGLAGGWGWDDYTIIVSYVSALSCSVFGFIHPGPGLANDCIVHGRRDLCALHL